MDDTVDPYDWVVVDDIIGSVFTVLSMFKLHSFRFIIEMMQANMNITTNIAQYIKNTI